MTDEERDRMLVEVHQAVVGIKDNPEENGLLGECKEMKNHLKKLNGDVSRNTTARKIGTWAGGLVGTFLIGVLIAIVSGHLQIGA